MMTAARDLSGAKARRRMRSGLAVASIVQRGAFIVATWLSLLALPTGPALAQSLLPTGFGTVNIGAPWDEVSAGFDYKDLSDASTLLERLNQECGYKTALVDSDDGDLLITVNDFVVTDLSYATPLEPNSDLMAVADLVMQTYGQPKSATMRDAIGKATLDRARVSHIELRYDAKNPVTFYISGPAVWQYQINVQYAQKRWHQNKNTRCARQRAKALRKAAKEQSKPAKAEDQ